MAINENIMTYDEWEVVKRAVQYFTIDKKGVREVKLVIKEPSKYYIDTILDFGGDYDSISDDMDFVYSFNLINWDDYL